MHYDLAVVGLGGMGSATLAEAAKRGAKVIGLEQFTRGHEFGSSTGRSRMIRKAYFEDPAYVPLLLRAYEKWRAYGQSKTANILFTQGLARRGYTSYALHPGVILTELGRHLTAEDSEGLAKRLPTFKTVEQGAATTVYAAVADGIPNGAYLEDAAVAGPANEDLTAGVMPYAVDADEAERLWQWSLEETSA